MKYTLLTILGITCLAGIQGKPQRPTIPFSARSEFDGCEIIENNHCTGILSSAEIAEIASYQDDVNAIIDMFKEGGQLYNAAYDEMVKLVDRWPQRPSGSEALEESIDYMLKELEPNLDHVWAEQVMVPHWVRGRETADLTVTTNDGATISKELRILGLGTSVGTSANGITAEVVVVHNETELKFLGSRVRDKIVVFNQGWIQDYPTTNYYRTNGASLAAAEGAVAALIESVAPFSLDTPHTGNQDYHSDVNKIPAACITKEDADLMSRYASRGEKMTVKLVMLDYNMPTTTSRNVIGQIDGSTYRDEWVAVTGHIDSWDVGQGAMDDGGGALISVMALYAAKALGKAPKRNLQVILWTSEEVGLIGCEEYARQHRDRLGNMSAAIESDSGTFMPRGLDFAGSNKAACIVKEIVKLTGAGLSTDHATKCPSVSSDITVLQQLGVPGLSLNNTNGEYFWYHHTDADTITMQDPIEMDYGAALFASASWVIANLDEKLPRQDVPPPSTTTPSSDSSADSVKMSLVVFSLFPLIKFFL